MVPENVKRLDFVRVASFGYQVFKGGGMNHLNSVLIEGVVLNGACSQDDGSFHFWIKSGSEDYEIRVFRSLADEIRDVSPPGTFVRASGQLALDRVDKRVYIRADVVSFKPAK
jgi:hypothetical protein